MNPTPASLTCTIKGQTMAKGNNTKSNKETKKPKKEKPKILATSDSGAGKGTVSVGGKKI